MAIDAGGARFFNRSIEEFQKIVKEADKRPTEAAVRVSTYETHDGEKCDCVDEQRTLKVGDKVELEHTCHDGRVDKLFVEIVSIDLPTHHAKVR